MNTNTHPVRALIGEMTEYLDQQVDPELDVIAKWRDRLEAALASAPPSAPVGVEAVRGAWLAAITLANNICVQESDRENDRDGDTGWINGTAECAKRIREYAHPTDAELLEMLDEAGANAAKAALSQQPAAPSGEAVAWAAMSANGSRVVSISLERDEYVGHVVPLYTAPQQPAAVDGDEVRRVAQHIGSAADYIDKAYPDAKMLDSGPILRNMRRWHERLTAALAAPKQPASGEEIMVNTPYDVFTLPLQPSGLLSGPRFVVHVPLPEQPVVPSGEAVGDWVLVPRTPTDAMLRAAQDAWMNDPLRRTTTIWWAMLAAAPQQPAAVDEAGAWAKQQPTCPGIYGIRGFNLCRPVSEQFEAVVVVREYGGELVCNLHESTSEDDLSSWAPICDLDPDFEWRAFAPGWEQQGGRADG
ncbi:hypothetical protein EIM50_13545 [Pseudoxanthomonas sp. SGD-10]|nr:hypothetical protein EIM50_13545 [Pseudoxanthomonas sp. SGD-10]